MTRIATIKASNVAKSSQPKSGKYNLWEGFKEVVKFIDNNIAWLDALMGKDYLYRTNNCRYGE